MWKTKLKNDDALADSVFYATHQAFIHAIDDATTDATDAATQKSINSTTFHKAFYQTNSVVAAALGGLSKIAIECHLIRLEDLEFFEVKSAPSLEEAARQATKIATAALIESTIDNKTATEIWYKVTGAAWRTIADETYNKINKIGAEINGRRTENSLLLFKNPGLYST